MSTTRELCCLWKPGSLIGHGYYPRKPKNEQGAWRIRSRCWKCKVCGKTMSILPDFLLFFRHYVVRVIESVLDVRFEAKSSWVAVKREIGAEGNPALRTMQRWCKAYGGEASLWLGAVQETLAQQDSFSVWLDLQGEVLKAQDAAEALFADLSKTCFLATERSKCDSGSTTGMG